LEQTKPSVDTVGSAYIDLRKWALEFAAAQQEAKDVNRICADAHVYYNFVLGIMKAEHIGLPTAED
jgi:hypothetical protein